MPFNFFNRAKSSSSKAPPRSLQPDDPNFVKFTALKVHIHGEIEYDIVNLSHHRTTHLHDQNHYFVPNPFEPSRPENRGVPFRMLVWELKDDMFTGESKEWRGRYSVWYRSDLRGSFYLVKQRHEKPVPGVSVRCVDIPVPRRAHYWFPSEICNIRKAILERR